MIDKRDSLILLGILIAVSIPVTLMVLVANGIISTPFG
jgi:hypothetical protein